MTLAELFRQEGREEGETKALARTAIKLLFKKFGFVPEELRSNIAKLDVTTLEILIDRVFDYESLDEVKKYIQ